MRLTNEIAQQIIYKHLIAKVLRNFEIQDGLTEGRILYGVPKDEP
jgi:sRNA-binding regulator protein Hfq